MKIHSKFKDYYDTARAYGIDEQCHYVRETQAFTYLDLTREDRNTCAPLGSIMPRGRLNSQINSLLIDTVVMSFCAKKYNGVRLYRVEEERPLNIYCWNIKQLDKAMFRYGSKNDKYNWRAPSSPSVWSSFTKQRKIVVNEFKNNGQENDQLIEMHHKIGVPVIVKTAENGCIVLNPILKDFEFFRVIKSTQAFQELNMFISGVLGGHSPKMVQISDQIRVAKHGFDKWSFRKMPTKKKKLMPV